MKLPKRVRVLIAVVILLTALAVPPKTFASISSCTATVNNSSVTPNSTNSFSFTVTNGDGANDANWIKLTVPSSNFVIAGSPSTPEGWSPSINGENTEMTITGSTLSQSAGAYPFSVQVSTTNSTAASKDWSIQLSDDGGSSTKPCDGSLGTAIEGDVIVNPPSISSIVVSGISDTKATISWTTDIPGTSIIDNGTTTDYGVHSADTNLVTSHSVNISGLTANTTYHYDVTSDDGSGHSADSGDNSFVTAAVGATVVNVVGTTTTTTVRVTATPTPTPVPDTSPPVVTVSTDITKPFAKAPTFQGTAVDRTGVAALDYSLDGGINWTPVDLINSPNTKSTAFSFTPVDLLDDNYAVVIRATDTLGNVGTTKIGTLVVDRLPPEVGGYVITLGPQVLAPMKNGTIIAMAGLDQKITLSAVGGPTTITLSILRNLSRLSEVILKKNLDNGLWSGILHFDEPGTYALKTEAIDGAGNKRERTLNTIVVLPGGNVSDGNVPVAVGTVSVYYLNNASKQFVLWDGGAYGQTNPQQLDASGAYHFYLPAGTFYFRISAPGFTPEVTNIFTLEQSFPISAQFTLKHGRELRFGPFVIPIPDFSEMSVPMDVSWPKSIGAQPSDTHLVGAELPYFTFPLDDTPVTSLSLHGKPTVLTVLNTWSPQAASQLATLTDLAKKKEINVVGIVPQETASSVTIFRKRSGLTIPIIADPDGTLIDALNIQSVPMHIFLDRKGIVKDVVSGMLTKEGLLDMLVK